MLQSRYFDENTNANKFNVKQNLFPIPLRYINLNIKK